MTSTPTSSAGGSAVTWLRLPAPTWGPVLRPGPGLSAGELASLRADGLVVAVAGGVHLVADLAGDPAARARALAELLPSRAVAAGGAAAWVHGAGPPADPVDALLPPGAGPSATGVPGLRVRCAALEAADVVRVGGVAVTSPTRTASDLARSDDAGAVPRLRALLARGVDPGDVLASLAGRRHATRARLVVAAALEPAG